jgi:phosphatidylglycerophosphatase A
MTTSATNTFSARDLGDPAVLVATWCGLGLSPVAPGTVGSLGAFPVLWLTSQLPWLWGLALVLGLFVLGIAVSERIERTRGGHDHGAIVIDEVVGQWLTIALPMYLLPGWLTWTEAAVIGFLLFRLFDIAKPPPIGGLDRRVSGGLGVMLDDLVAGVMAAALLAIYPLLVI